MTKIASPPRHVFVGGLHRSGTSLLTQLIAAHPKVSRLHAPEVPEGEGAYLQGAIPHTARHGVPGAFAFDPEQHLTENHPLNRLETRQRIDLDWGPRFDPAQPWRLEKSPVNLLRTRLYQQLFPSAHFVIVLRHPVAVAQATAKWTDASFDDLILHWDTAHRILLDDLPYLHAALVVRYEDLVADAQRTLDRLFQFLALDPASAPATPSVYDGNSHYRSANGPVGLAADRFGYGPSFSDLRPMPEDIMCRHPLNETRRQVIETPGHRTSTRQSKPARGY